MSAEVREALLGIVAGMRCEKRAESLSRSTHDAILDIVAGMRGEKRAAGGRFGAAIGAVKGIGKLWNRLRGRGPLPPGTRMRAPVGYAAMVGQPVVSGPTYSPKVWNAMVNTADYTTQKYLNKLYRNYNGLQQAAIRSGRAASELRQSGRPYLEYKMQWDDAQRDVDALRSYFHTVQAQRAAALQSLRSMRSTLQPAAVSSPGPSRIGPRGRLRSPMDRAVTYLKWKLGPEGRAAVRRKATGPAMAEVEQAAAQPGAQSAAQAAAQPAVTPQSSPVTETLVPSVAQPASQPAVPVNQSWFRRGVDWVGGKIRGLRSNQNAGQQPIGQQAGGPAKRYVIPDSDNLGGQVRWSREPIGPAPAPAPAAPVPAPVAPAPAAAPAPAPAAAPAPAPAASPSLGSTYTKAQAIGMDFPVGTIVERGDGVKYVLRPGTFTEGGRVYPNWRELNLANRQVFPGHPFSGNGGKIITLGGE